MYRGLVLGIQLALIGFSPNASAAAIGWDGSCGAANNWFSQCGLPESQITNWDSDVFPDSGSDVTIGAGAGPTEVNAAFIATANVAAPLLIKNSLRLTAMPAQSQFGDLMLGTPASSGRLETLGTASLNGVTDIVNGGGFGGAGFKAGTVINNGTVNALNPTEAINLSTTVYLSVSDFHNQGTVNVAPFITLNLGSTSSDTTIRNKPGANWNFFGDGAVIFSTGKFFANEGTLTKSGSGTTRMIMPLQNLDGGSVSIDGGSLTLTAFGPNSFDPDAEINQIDGGRIVIAPGTDFIMGEVEDGFVTSATATRWKQGTVGKPDTTPTGGTFLVEQGSFLDIESGAAGPDLPRLQGVALVNRGQTDITGAAGARSILMLEGGTIENQGGTMIITHGLVSPAGPHAGEAVINDGGFIQFKGISDVRVPLHVSGGGRVDVFFGADVVMGHPMQPNQHIGSGSFAVTFSGLLTLDTDNLFAGDFGFSGLGKVHLSDRPLRVFSDTVTTNMTGAGEFWMSGPDALIDAQAAGAKFVNTGNFLFEGGTLAGDIINNGVMTVSGAETKIVRNTLTNNQEIKLGAGVFLEGELNVAGPDGVLRITNGIISPGAMVGGINVDGGKVEIPEGISEINVPLHVSNGGELRVVPAASPGLASLELTASNHHTGPGQFFVGEGGSLTLAGVNTFDGDFALLGPGDYLINGETGDGQLVVNGVVRLDEKFNNAVGTNVVMTGANARITTVGPDAKVVNYGNFLFEGGTITGTLSTLAELLVPQGLADQRKIVGTLRSVSGTIHDSRIILEGQLLVEGNYIDTTALNGNSLMSIAIGGQTPGTGFGQLLVDGSAQFIGSNSNLRFELVDGFVPSQGEFFDVLIADVITGQIDRVFMSPLLSQLGFGVSLIDLPGGQQQALRLAVQTALVPLPGALVMFLSCIATLLLSRRPHLAPRARRA